MARSLLLALPLICACTSSVAGLSRTSFEQFEREESRGPVLGDIPAVDIVNRANSIPADAPPPPPLEFSRQADRQVIYNGSLMIQVAEPERVEKEILALAKEMGGWIQKLDGPRITLRVQASKFDAAFDR